MEKIQFTNKYFDGTSGLNTIATYRVVMVNSYNIININYLQCGIEMEVKKILAHC